MTIQTTYSDARAHFAELIDRVIDERETVIVTKRGEIAVAIIAADEYNSLVETAHLLRSPANAARIFDAMAEAARGEARVVPVDELLREKGLGGA